MSDFLKVESIFLSTVENHDTIEGAPSGTDVIVTMSDGQRYIAVFNTYENMLSSLSDNSALPHRPYLWFESLVLVNRINQEGIAAIVDEMIDAGDFQLIFKPISQ